MPKVHKMQCPGDYAVGYGRPPEAGKIKPGERRNPNGRPKKLRALGSYSSETLDELVLQEISRLIPLSEQGKQITLPVVQGILRGQVFLALKGNQRAVQDIMQRAERAIAAREKSEAGRAQVDFSNMDVHEAARIYQDMVAGRF